MRNDRPDSYYDLEDAARIAARLRPGANRAEEVTASTETRAYVRFNLSELRFGPRATTDAAPPAAEAVAPPVAASPIAQPFVPPQASTRLEGLSEIETTGSAGWGKMLDWCVDALDADAAFIVDARGLVIGGAGLLGSGEVEETGARLIVAFGQADRMLSSHGASLSLSVELESGWLVGIRIPSRDDEEFILGIVSNEALSQDIRRELAKAFSKKALES